MRFFELQEPMAVMPFVLRTLEVYGLRGDRRHLVRFVLLTLGPWLVMGIPKTIFGFGDQLDLVIRGYSELLYLYCIEIRMAIFAWNRAELEEFANIVQGIFSKVEAMNSDSVTYKSVLKSNQMMDKSAKVYVTSALVISGIFLFLPALQTGAIYVMNQKLNETDKLDFVTCTVHELNGINIQGNIMHYSIHMCFVSIMHMILAYKLSTIDIILFCGIRSIITLFQIVSIKLENIKRISGKALKDEVAEIVEIHVEALKCVKILERMSTVSNLVQTVSTVIIWIAMVLSISNNPSLNTVNLFVLLILITAQTYSLCKLGTELTTESLAITTSSYDSQWTDFPVDIQQALRFVLQRAQKWEGLTAARFFRMNIERFGALMQTSYSIFVVMREQLVK